METKQKQTIRILSFIYLLCHALWVVSEYAVMDGNVLRLELASGINLIVLLIMVGLSKTRED